ncbi:RagB/SusD family nutrient uptake outer membrane protein [Polaribacter tangerinus]|uniref:RagB/SusD family nutrient uptake outer membrane protein n=1 Tax=Polaribacter tangerinus TaxID=1920034 RepID=UPI000B4B71B6|nr:RagB/SusD family nutrient uptake outer membrane protein [Polaribacter tangerinus]
MKKNMILRVVFLLTSSVLFLNCSDKLNEEQELVVIQGDIDYTSAEGAQGALIGAYRAFQSVGWEQIPLISVRGDDVNSGGKGDQQGFADTDSFIYDNNYWMYNSLWQSWFQDVLQITVQIDQLKAFKENGVDAKLIDQYIAECKTLRAFVTLQLSKVFGDVYKIDTPDQTQIEVLPKDEIMQWISEQMDEAVPNLLDVNPALRGDIPGGITKYTAYTVKAMANLELKNYQAVADAAGEVIKSNKFELYNDFYNLFKIPGKLAKENILEIQYSDFGQSSGENVGHLYAFYGSQNWTPAVAGATSGWGFYEPSKKFIKFMLDRNETVRLETSVLFTDAGIDELIADGYTSLPSFVSNTTRDGDRINNYSRALFASGKHYLPSVQLTPGRTSYGTNKNYTVIRYSEVLLMYAEALTRGANGTAGTADQAVNTVRLRAKMGTLSGVTTQDVLDEKFAELAMEWGIRYYDMVRLEKVNELNYEGRSFTMEKRFLPYPQAQIDQSFILRDYINNN